MDYAIEAAGTYSGDSLDSVISMADSFIRRQYLAELNKAQAVPLDARTSNIIAGKNIRMFRLVSLSYSETDDLYPKVANVFRSVAEFEASQFLILDSDGFHMSFYLGIAGNEQDKLSTQFQTFKSSFQGNFPGGKIEMLNTAKNEELLRSIFQERNIKISAVSDLKTSKEISGDQIYGIGQLADGMYGKPFTMIFLSEAVGKGELYQMRQSLEAVYTELSPFREYTVSINRSESMGVSQSFGMTKSESVSEGKSVTESTSFGKSQNRTQSHTKNQQAEEKKAKNQLAGTALSLAAIIGGIGGASAINPLQGLFYGGSISNILGSAQLLLNGADPNGTESAGEGKSYSIGFSEGETSSRQEGFSMTKSVSENTSDSAGRTLQMRYENKAVADLMEVIGEQISRLSHIQETGGFRCAAYFVTGDNSTAFTAANMYRSLLGGRSSLGQNNAINVWSEPGKVEDICKYLERMKHPVFHFDYKPDYPVFTADTLVASDEIPMYVSLPAKSVGGLPVSLRAEFARDIIQLGEAGGKQIEIGRVFHLGKEGQNRVYLSQSDLSGHMFVAGSTGMGKSNFCYGLLHRLYQNRIRFMVIEPAKGEYSQVFGGYQDVHVFGTNPQVAPLLRINPFSFPQGIHVNEHIDRLLEIFNSCWPMYAAMPQVLKEGIETVYKNCGYNLITGSTRQKGRFPSFSDLLETLPRIIRQSEFSGEVQGNYIGSLVTRVKSLTDGLYGCIFTEDEIDPAILFDENVLIDLSRVGSGETKSLIMGIIIMKLQEYRMCHAKMNTPLSHVTILEEAHHLLKASTASSPEGVNLRAMALEMITNAIAEMRTYGEGFVIADQSPTLMDLSVIRNTNTKVVFKLPEYSDRLAVGNAMSLTDAQMNEVSKLERGVAAIYQSNWDNAVLARIHRFGNEKFIPYVHEWEEYEEDSRGIDTQFLALLLQGRLPESAKTSLNREACRGLLKNSAYVDGDRKEYLGLLGNYMEHGVQEIPFAKLCRYTDRILAAEKMMDSCGSTESIEEWEKEAMGYIQAIADVTEDEMKELILLCMNIYAGNHPEAKKMYFRYFSYCRPKK